MASVRGALADRYAVEREIGRGGMSTVYLARDLRHSRLVAIKVLDPGLAFTIGPDRFRREIATLARLHHPNILPLLDSGALPEGRSLYYIMPFVTGESLRARLDREHQLPLDEAVRLAVEVADALDYAHGNDVIHRDIKPENILLQSGHAVLADFGIARAPDPEGSATLSTVGLAIGTPQYMSPEQAAGRTDVDGRSDQYSLACVVYEMVAGVPPFEGNTPQTVAARHKSDAPPSLRRNRARVPRGLESAIDRALSKTPADRFKRSGEFARALTTGLSTGEGWLIPSWPRMQRGLRSNALAAGLLVALALAVAALSWSLARPAGGRRPARTDWVVGYPLAELGERDTLLRTGESIAGMLSEAMQQVPVLRWIDGWSLLDPLARQDARSLTVSQVRQLALDQGARYAIHGTFVTTRDSVTVDLRLLDAVADSQVAQASASGDRATAVPVRLGLRALMQLLPRMVAPGAPFSSDALAAVASGDAGAVALWMQGDAAYRRARYARAQELYAEAVARDSTLAIAAFKGAQAAIWSGNDAAAEPLAALALRHAERLPHRYASFAGGVAAYLAGLSDSAVASLGVALLPDARWAEAWTMLGEVYYHQFPRAMAPLDSLADAAFETAASADSGFTPALPHLIEAALRRGDLPASRHRLARYQAGDADSSSWYPYALALDCLSDESNRFDWAAAARRDSTATLFAAKLLAVGGAEPRCARGALAGLAATGAYSYPALGLLLSLDAAQGRQSEVARRLQNNLESGNRAATIYVAMAATAGLDVGDSGQAFIARLKSRQATLPADWLWWLGSLAAARGDSALLRDVRGYAGRAAPNDAGSLLALDAGLARLRGDTTQALTLYRQLLARPAGGTLDWDLRSPCPGERLALARLELARGDAQRALADAAVFDGQPLAFLPYLPASLELRIAALERLGRIDQARVLRQRLAMLRQP
ncbi:MAG TPA: serine/threonine-protein kinase [Gemmatimonadales bacterium]|nr:serine/threonine-protein kinase [Gemmatimonadales bacterium]